MLHRKQHHSEMAQECKNGDKYVYEKTCWYMHEKIFSRKGNNKKMKKMIKMKNFSRNLKI